ncbi:MAG: hypothetical protein R6U57_13845 [Anaerolineales bacterium]
MDKFLSAIYDLDAPHIVEANRRGEITSEQRMHIANVVSFFQEFRSRGPWLLMLFLIPFGCIFLSALMLSQDVPGKIVLAFAIVVFLSGLALFIFKLARFLTWRKTVKRELEDATIHHAMGELVFGKEAFEVKVSDQRLRLPYESRGDLVPGVHYTVYYLPESRIVLSAEPLEPIREENVSESLTKILADVNQFSLEGLPDNRRGRLHRSQMRQFIPNIIVSLLLVVVPVGIIAYQVLFQDLTLDLGNLDAGMLVMGVVFLALVLVGLYRLISLLSDMMGGWVESVEGIGTKEVEVKEDAEGDTSTYYYYVVGDMRFQVKKPAYRAFEEHREYRVFYTPSSKQMVNIEVL